MAKTKQKLVLEQSEEQKIDAINNKLQLSFIMDLQKPNVNKFERAEVIKHYMVRNLVSFKEMCVQLHIGKSTLSGWLKWGEMTKEEYEAYQEEGMSETEITNIVKGSRNTNVKEALESNESLLMVQMKATLKSVERVRTRSLDDKTWDLITELRNKLNYVLYQAEKNGGKKV